MNIKEQIEGGYVNLTKVKKMVKEWDKNPKLIKQVMPLILGDDKVISMRASWMLLHLCFVNPKRVYPLIPQLMIFFEKKDVHTGTIRNIIRIFHEIEVPEKYCGQLFDLCIGFTRNTTLPLAVRAFAIISLGNTCKRYPDLKPEVELILSELNSFPQPPSIVSSVKYTSKILLKL